MMRIGTITAIPVMKASLTCEAADWPAACIRRRVRGPSEDIGLTSGGGDRKGCGIRRVRERASGRRRNRGTRPGGRWNYILRWARGGQ
ncbi:hypothetical protein GCM10009021_15510 [Halarchaeum nitratireducens]|uniref:Uncharacterized protein n=1 Tax=Halarchaeum nitratireducens TaxID=489913 RepID=A0A830GBH9_9EURY|nr:hypothetical protein GCM10009021_15510 [Halarchaeum nitratireducens]